MAAETAMMVVTRVEVPEAAATAEVTMAAAMMAEEAPAVMTEMYAVATAARSLAAAM